MAVNCLIERSTDRLLYRRPTINSLILIMYSRFASLVLNGSSFLAGVPLRRRTGSYKGIHALYRSFPALALPSLFHFPSRLLSLPAARFALFLRSGSLKSVLILLSLDVFSREDSPFRTVVSRVTCGEGYRPTCPRYILWDPKCRL